MKSYKIKKNSHYSGFHFRPFLCASTLSFNFTFNDSCKYDLHNIDQYDIHKLTGLSFGYHHNNSIRLGWRYNTQTSQIDLYPYIYYLSNKPKGYLVPVIASVNINEKVFGKIIRSKNSYRIMLYNKTEIIADYSFEIDSDIIPDVGYILFPYFGGNMKAPHDITIQLDFDIIK